MSQEASLVIGGLTLLIVAVFMLAKWIAGAVAGHAIMHWWLARRSARRAREAREHQDRGIE